MQNRLLQRVKEGPLLWLLPMLSILLLFRLYPMFEGIRLSFTNASVLDSVARYVGFDTFSRIISNVHFVQILRATAGFVFSCIVLQLGLGLVTAIIIKAGVGRKLKGTLFIRGSILLPWILWYCQLHHDAIWF